MDDLWPRRSWALTRWQYPLALLVGVGAGGLLLVAARFSLLLAVMVLSALCGLLACMMLRQLRRPLLALLAVSLPLHLDRYFLFYPLQGGASPLEAVFRISASDIILLLLYFLWLMETAVGRGVQVRIYARVTFPALLFLMLGLISIQFAPEPRLAIFQLSEIAKGMLIYFYVANRVREEADIRWVLGGLMAAVLFESGLALYQAATGHPLGLTMLGEGSRSVRQVLGEQTAIRPIGTLWHTNHLAMYLGLLVPVIGSAVLAPRSYLLRLTAGLIALLGTVVVLVTLSRGAWLGLSCSVVILLAFAVRRRAIRPYVVPLVVGLAVVAVFAVNALSGNAIFLRMTVDDQGAGESRLPLMRGALEVIADYPLFGSGLQNYSETIKPYDITGEYTERGLLPVVHNLFLLLAAEIGLLGLGAFLWLLLAAALPGIRYVRAHPLSLPVALTAGLLVSQLHIILHGLVDFTLMGEPQLLLVFWYLLGFLVALAGNFTGVPQTSS